MLGVVKFFDNRRGFGFITADGQDYFVHYSEIKGPGFKTLGEAVKVDFKAISGPKGFQATEVSVVRDN